MLFKAKKKIHPFPKMCPVKDGVSLINRYPANTKLIDKNSPKHPQNGGILVKKYIIKHLGITYMNIYIYNGSSQ